MRVILYRLSVFHLFVFLLPMCFLSGCGQPVLESLECIEARESLKRFYSFHLGNDMAPSKENLVKRKTYLSERLTEELSGAPESKKDYFTQTDDYPKTFRVGKCQNTASADDTTFEVVIFWRTNDENIERSLEVEVINEEANWVVDKVRAKK